MSLLPQNIPLQEIQPVRQLPKYHVIPSELLHAYEYAVKQQKSNNDSYDKKIEELQRKLKEERQKSNDLIKAATEMKESYIKLITQEPLPNVEIVTKSQVKEEEIQQKKEEIINKSVNLNVSNVSSSTAKISNNVNNDIKQSQTLEKSNNNEKSTMSFNFNQSLLNSKQNTTEPVKQENNKPQVSFNMPQVQINQQQKQETEVKQEPKPFNFTFNQLNKSQNDGKPQEAKTQQSTTGGQFQFNFPKLENDKQEVKEENKSIIKQEDKQQTESKPKLDFNFNTKPQGDQATNSFNFSFNPQNMTSKPQQEQQKQTFNFTFTNPNGEAQKPMFNFGGFNLNKQN